MKAIQSYFGKEVDNSSLVLFRMGFGFLAAAESWGAIMTGWVQDAFVSPKFTFSFIGLDWLQPLEGNGMLYYYFLMGCFGMLIMLGLFYRFSTFMFLVLWTGTYLMQKSHYNNHYYLLVLLSALMMIVPAHKSYALDAKWGLTNRSETCYYGYIFLFLAQLTIVYFFASFNKIYPDWLAAKPIGLWFEMKKGMPIIGPVLEQRWFQYVISYGGILYDGTIVFLLFNRSTRKIGFVLSIAFNLFNSLVFQIGIFPYLMILSSVLFYPGENMRKVFLKNKPIATPSPSLFAPGLTWIFLIYLCIQTLLPLRHWMIPGDVNWTEEGHRMSWRMMLRSKTGSGIISVVDGVTGKKATVPLKAYLTSSQMTKVKAFPDMTWQFAQRIKSVYEEKGWQDVKVYAHLNASLNGGNFYPIIDPMVDLAVVDWSYFWHSDWKLTPKEND